MKILPINSANSFDSGNIANAKKQSFGLKIKKDAEFKEMYDFLTKHHAKEKVDAAIGYIEKLKPANGSDDYSICFYPIKMRTKYYKRIVGFFKCKEVKEFIYSPAIRYSFYKGEPPHRADYMTTLTKQTNDDLYSSTYRYRTMQSIQESIKEKFESFLWMNE